jgi:hypothetical protein
MESIAKEFHHHLCVAQLPERSSHILSDCSIVVSWIYGIFPRNTILLENLPAHMRESTESLSASLFNFFPLLQASATYSHSFQFADFSYFPSQYLFI